MPDMHSSYQGQVIQPYVSSLTPDIGPPTWSNASKSGEWWQISLAGNITINAPLIKGITVSGLLDTPVGARLLFEFIHDNTASVYTITWNAVFKKAAGAFANTNTANATDTIEFRWDGANWVEIARALNLS